MIEFCGYLGFHLCRFHMSISSRAWPAVPETAGASGRSVGGTLGLPEFREEAEALANCNFSPTTRVTGGTQSPASKLAGGLDIH